MAEFDVAAARKIAERLLKPDAHHGPADRGFAGFILNAACDEIDRLREAGDALAVYARLSDKNPLIVAWKEARREPR